MFTHGTSSSRSTREHADVHGPSTRSAIARHDNLNPTHLSSALHSRRFPIARTSRAFSTHARAARSARSFSWDTETLVGDVTPADPGLFSDTAPSQVTLINARAEFKTPKARPQQSLAPIVYGNGHWVLRPKSGVPVDEKSLAQQSLAAVLKAQSRTGSCAARAEQFNEKKPETEDDQIAFMQRLLVEMGYSYDRQRTLRWNDLSTLEQHALVERVVEVTHINAVRRIDERVAKQRRERRAEWGEQEGCCPYREYQSGAVCERCMMWEGDGWTLLV